MKVLFQTNANLLNKVWNMTKNFQTMSGRIILLSEDNRQRIRLACEHIQEAIKLLHQIK